MAGESTPPGERRALLTRVIARLTAPVSYLAVLGGLQLVLMWTVRARYGILLPVLTGVTWIVLLLGLGRRPGSWRVKLWGITMLGLLTAFAPTIAAIAYRARVGLTTEHDGLLQLESAVDRLLRGQAIYGVDWSNTPMAAYPWDLTPGGNPALHHLAYFPLTVMVGIPFRLLSDWLGAGFDYREVLLAFALLGLVSLLALPIALERRFMLICAVFVSPLITLYLWPGRNDIEFLAVTLLTMTLLARGRMVLGGAALGAAMALKPFAWPALPFFLLLLWLRRQAGGDRKEILMSSLALVTIPLLTIAPFLLGNPSGFWSDTVLYSSGGVPDAYPIAGLGFSALLYHLGVITHRTDAFPFAAVQLAAMIPVLLIGARAFVAGPTMARWFGGYAALLLAFTFFARFFNDNYAAVVITLLLCVRPLGDRLLVHSARSAAEPLAA